jgi:hypothetical protein
VKLNEKLNEYNLSFQDIDKLVNVPVNAKDYQFDAKKIVAAVLYGYPRSTAAVYVLNNSRDYNRKGQLKKE